MESKPAAARGAGLRSEHGQISSGGRDRTYEVVRGGGAPALLLLMLHGSHQSGAKVRAFSGNSFDQLVRRDNAVVVYPDAYRGLWNDARSSMISPARAEGVDDVAFLSALIDHFRGLYGPLPVHVAGYSNGGQMVIRLIHEIPDRLAGAVLIGATQPAPENLLPVEDKRLPLPVLLIHGTRDPLVPYDGGIASLWGFSPRGKGLSAPESARYFASRNGITTEPKAEQLPHQPASGKTSVTVTRFRQEGRPGVTLYTVINGGHVIPNPTKSALLLFGPTTRDISADDVISSFIAEQSTTPATSASR